MAITAGDLVKFRKREAAQAAIRSAAMGSSSVVYRRISGVEVAIATDSGDTQGSHKVTALTTAIETVAEKGFQLPPLSFFLSNAATVECVAFMGNAAGNREAQVFLGPKFVIKNPQNKAAVTTIPGGSGQKGQRGIADQQYDGTQRWFGNPKLLAQGATIVVHELGHVLHELLDEQEFWTQHEAATQARATMWLGAAAEVSEYATKAPLEFCAEVFAGVLAGKKYSGAVHGAYTLLGGPIAANFW